MSRRQGTQSKRVFDGVELHGANGYLIEQFLNPGPNRRHDDYGGSVANRNRFAIEMASAVAEAIGADKTAIRISPFNSFNDMLGDYPEIPQRYESLAKALGTLRLAYVHVAAYSRVGEPLLRAVKNAFGARSSSTEGSTGGRRKRRSTQAMRT